MHHLEPITQKILAHMRANNNSFTLACRQSSKSEAIVRYVIEKVKEEDSMAKLIVIAVHNVSQIKTFQERIIDASPVDAIRGFGVLEFRNKTNVSLIRIVDANDETLRGLRPTVVIYDEPAFYNNSIKTISYLNASISHYVTSYNPQNLSFFAFVKSYPKLVINWKEVYGNDVEWFKCMSEQISPADFFNEYENGIGQ